MIAQPAKNRWTWLLADNERATKWLRSYLVVIAFNTNLKLHRILQQIKLRLKII